MSLLKRLVGNDSQDRETAEEMRGLLHELQQERARHEALLETVRAATERLEQLGGPIAETGSQVDAVGARLAELEQRFAAMVQLSGRFMALDERADGLAEDHKRAEAKIAHTLEEAGRIQSAFEAMGHKIDLAIGLKEKLDTFLDVDKPFQVLRGEADAIRAQLEGTSEHLTRLREQHERHLDAQKLSTTKVEALDRRREELSRDLQDKERRVASVEQAIRGMDGVQQTVDDVRRDIGTLKALGDFVSQKSAALEAQRDSIESALARADQLDRAMRQIDAGVRQQQENERTLGAMQDQVKALQSLHETVVERSREIAQLQRDANEKSQATRQDLAVMQDEMKATVERFDFESRGLESVTQRVADLRGALTDFENRFRGLSESSVTAAELKSQTHALTVHLQVLTGQVGQLDEEFGKLQALRRDVDETARTAHDIGAQMARIEESRPAVESAVGDLQRLGSVHASVKDALEQAQLAHAEIARAREDQSETRSWLTGVEHSLSELKTQAGELRTLAPTIESVLAQARRIGESMASIESRREFVEDVQRRLTDLGALSGSLDERGRALLARMEAAEQRFVGLASHAEEAERTANSIAAVVSSVSEAGREAHDIAKTVAAAEARCESVEGLAERTRTLREEIEQRQHALEEATKDIQQASELRREAAASAQQLDELAKRLTSSITSVERRMTQAETLSTQLEDRAAGLQSVDKRLDQFDERLVKWELVEQEIARSLDQITARQGTVEALQADLDRMFAMAEKTAANVREITSAHREIEESKGLLKDVMNRLREVRDASSAIDDRKRQMTKAEERLARADALLIDVRSSLEVLQGQKVLVDQAVEKAGSLKFLLKQAEGMIEGLREERNMTADVRGAMSLVRQEDDADDEDVAQAA